VDGRRQRAERNRERLLDAIEAALREADVFKPESIASRAGLSLSTLFRHFKDLDGLDAAMRERVTARIRPHLADLAFAGDTPDRVRQLVARRAAAFAELAPFQRVVRRQPTEAEAERVAQARLADALRIQLDAALGAELSAPERAGTRALVEALLSVEAWENLTFGQRLEPGRASGLLVQGVLALLHRGE
jgi:AcrR family transcriptional regulator